jgi:hypothetical protein
MTLAGATIQGEEASDRSGSILVTWVRARITVCVYTPGFELGMPTVTDLSPTMIMSG